MTQDLSFRPRSGLRRVPGGVAALSYPTALVVAAVSVDFRAVGDGSDIATALLATVLFVIAAPTAWIFAIDFIQADQFTVIFVGVITSFPLWYLLGVKLARAAAHWTEWITAYLKVSLVWTVLWILVLTLASVVWA